jgi:hypothetical protein
MARERYRGSCQCGAVQFEATLDLSETVTCNCSRCQRLGSVLAFTSADGFALLQGEDALTPFQFNKGAITHLFCRTCGIQSFARGVGPNGAPMAAVNVNTLDGVDPRALSSHHYDGRSA